MTAGTNAYVRCDGTVATDLTDSGEMSCTARVEGGVQPDGTWVFPRTQTEARKLAGARGWFRVRHPRWRSWTEDFCPDHEDQAHAKAKEYGVKATRPKPAGDPK